MNRPYDKEILNSNRRLEGIANRLLRKLDKPKKKRSKKKRVLKEKTVSYFKYIKSKSWEDRKNKFFQTNKRECKACGDSTFVEVHHMTYSKLGSEKDEDLIALCKNCHKEYHNKNGTSSNMFESTHEYVYLKRSGMMELLGK